MSGGDVGSGSEYSPNKRLSSPPVKHRPLHRQEILGHRTLTRNMPPSYQQPEVERARTLKSPLFLLDDIMNKDKQQCNEPVLVNKYSDSVSEVPLYICPPPPPMDDHSPTEETRLLLHSTMVSPLPRQPGNSISKGANPSS